MESESKIFEFSVEDDYTIYDYLKLINSSKNNKNYNDKNYNDKTNTINLLKLVALSLRFYDGDFVLNSLRGCMETSDKYEFKQMLSKYNITKDEIMLSTIINHPDYDSLKRDIENSGLSSSSGLQIQTTKFIQPKFLDLKFNIGEIKAIMQIFGKTTEVLLFIKDEQTNNVKTSQLYFVYFCDTKSINRLHILDINLTFDLIDENDIVQIDDLSHKQKRFIEVLDSSLYKIEHTVLPLNIPKVEKIVELEPKDYPFFFVTIVPLIVGLMLGIMI